MSVWFDVKASNLHAPDDGYPTLLKNALGRYSEYEQRLFREESRYVLELCDMHGVNMFPETSVSNGLWSALPKKRKRVSKRNGLNFCGCLSYSVCSRCFVSLLLNRGQLTEAIKNLLSKRPKENGKHFRE